MRKTIQAFLLNATCCALIFAGWTYGYIEQVYTTDITHLTKVITVLGVACLLRLMWLSFKLDKGMTIAEYDKASDDSLFATSHFFRIGFLGTLIGFSYVIMNMDVADAAKMFVTIKTGFGTKLYVSILGMTAYIWVSVADHLNRR